MTQKHLGFLEKHDTWKIHTRNKHKKQIGRLSDFHAQKEVGGFGTKRERGRD